MIAIARQLLAVLLLLTALGTFADAATHCTPPRNCAEAGILCDCGSTSSPARAASCLQDCQFQMLAAPSPPAFTASAAALELSSKTAGYSDIATAPPVPPPRLL